MKIIKTNFLSKSFIARVCVLAMMVSVSSVVKAEGVAPYLPLKLDPILENEIERLANAAGIHNLTKPYNVATVYFYLEKIRMSHPKLYSRVNMSLKPYADKFGLTHRELGVRSGGDGRLMPNEHGTYAEDQVFANVRGQWQMADWLGFYVGGQVNAYSSSTLDEEYLPAGSVISIGVDWAQVDIGYKDIWLSPFEGSGQLLSTNAENMLSVSMSNNLPIEFLGIGWQYNTFLAQMSRQLVEFREGEPESDDERPLLAGVHISMHPVDWWSIGATRVFQFGGGERPVNLSTLVRAFTDPRGSDNDASVGEESGNQLAAVVSRVHFDGRLPFSVALELAGEDTSNNKNYQLGNTALTAGIYFPYFFSDNLSLNFEYSDWQDAWYVNNVYDEGYVNEGAVLGHWAMQSQRELNLSEFGTSYYLSSQWQMPNDHVASLVVRSAKHKDSGGEEFQSSLEMELEYVVPCRSASCVISVYAGQDIFGEDFNQLSISLRR